MVAMQRMLNKRFGHNTWTEIVDLREERQKENKIKRSKAKEKFLIDRERKRKKMKYWLQQAGNTIILAACVAGIWWWLSYLIKCAGNCF